MNLCISQALLCKTTYCEFNKYILSACVFSGNEPMALALIAQCSTSWVKCQEFGFICFLTMSSGWNEVSHSLSNIPNCQEKNVTFLYTWFSGMSIVCTDCAHYTKSWIINLKSIKLCFNSQVGWELNLRWGHIFCCSVMFCRQKQSF